MIYQRQTTPSRDIHNRVLHLSLLFAVLISASIALNPIRINPNSPGYPFSNQLHDKNPTKSNDHRAAPNKLHPHHNDKRLHTNRSREIEESDVNHSRPNWPVMTAVVAHDRSGKSITFSNICVGFNKVYFFPAEAHPQHRSNNTKNNMERIDRQGSHQKSSAMKAIAEWARSTGSAGVIGDLGTQAIWQQGVWISGSSLVLVSNARQGNNLQHMWYGKQFPFLAHGVEGQMHSNSTVSSFANMIVDGALHTTRTELWHRGLTSLLVRVLSETNADRGDPPIKLLVSSTKTPICLHDATIVGDGNDMRKMMRGGVVAAARLVQHLRTAAYSQAGISAPLPLSSATTSKSSSMVKYPLSPSILSEVNMQHRNETRNRCFRTVVIFAKLDTNHKRWINAYLVVEAVRKHFIDRGLSITYWPRMPRLSFLAQVRTFASIDLFVSPDGSHQMPAIWMATNATVLQTAPDTGLFRPWNLVFGLHSLLPVSFDTLPAKTATRQQYDEHMKVVDPRELVEHKRMDASHMVDPQLLIEYIERRLSENRAECVHVKSEFR